MRAIRRSYGWHVQPGTEFGGYRIEAVEREDAGAAVVLARDPLEGHAVALHIADEPPGALSTVRFLERARRLESLAHPHLLGVYDACTLEGRAVAVAQAPPGRRLDELLADGPLRAATAARIARQVASAVEALEGAGAEPPPLTPERIWVDGSGDAHLDGLDARIGLVALPPAASSSAALARMVGDMTPRVPGRLSTALERARDGAYLSAGQFASELRTVETLGQRRRRETALAVALIAAFCVAAALAALW
jgi:hypothetical protein